MRSSRITVGALLCSTRQRGDFLARARNHLRDVAEEIFEQRHLDVRMRLAEPVERIDRERIAIDGVVGTHVRGARRRAVDDCELTEGHPWGTRRKPRDLTVGEIKRHPDLAVHQKIELACGLPFTDDDLAGAETAAL